MPNSPSKITESTTSNQQQMPNKINFSSLNEENERITNSLSPPENNKNIILNNSTTSPPHLKEEDSSPPPHLVFLVNILKNLLIKIIYIY